jgi:hypothetical protein
VGRCFRFVPDAFRLRAGNAAFGDGSHLRRLLRVSD